MRASRISWYSRRESTWEALGMSDERTLEEEEEEERIPRKKEYPAAGYAAAGYLLTTIKPNIL